jgi:hypothetical protein
MLLADVIAQVVELHLSCFKHLDQFEVAPTHRASGAHRIDVMIVRVMKINRFAIERFFFPSQQRLKTHAVEALLWPKWQACQLEDCRTGIRSGYPAPNQVISLDPECGRYFHPCFRPCRHTRHCPDSANGMISSRTT